MNEYYRAACFLYSKKKQNKTFSMLSFENSKLKVEFRRSSLKYHL
jgi:hypothetical protein